MSKLKISKKNESILIEKKINSEIVFQGYWMRVQRDIVKLSDGSESFREFILHPGAALMIPVLPNGKLLFIKQFRYPMGQVFYEFPAGKIDKNETSLQTAQRELIEEVGYKANRLKLLTKIHPVIGYGNEHIDIYLADHLVHVGENPDQGEFVIPVEMTFKQAMKKLLAHEITDVKTQVALFWYEKFISKKLK